MSYSLIFRDVAYKEFTEAFIWYEEQQIGLGQFFREKIHNKLEKISQNPLHYPKSHKNFHQALIDKFPFLIVYSVDEISHSIIIFAIFHTSRSPKKKFNYR